MSSRRKTAAAVAGLLSLAFLGGGCSLSSSSSSSLVSTGANEVLDTSGVFSDADLDSSYDESSACTITLADGASSSSSSSVSVSGDTVTVKGAGTFLVSGSLSSGSLVVDAEDCEVQLVFNGVSITNATSAALYVKDADRVYVTEAEGTENVLSTTSSFVDIDDNNIDGAVFSKDGITFNGTGSLTVTCPEGHGIVGKDDVVFAEDGAYTITAGSHAVQAKDSLCVSSGTFDLTAGKDGLHAENSDDDTLGYIYIEDGDFTIEADGDGMDCSYVLEIADGAFDIETGGGSGATVSDDDSCKGLKADVNLVLGGGEYELNCADDGVHSNDAVTISGGDFSIRTGDDGVHASGTLLISGGTIDVTESYEGIEGMTIDITGGEISVVSDDDGLNAAGGNDSSGGTGFLIPGWFSSSSSSSSSDLYINIAGGKVTVDADGDGIDSNGILLITGGEVYVSGPSSSSAADQALDCGDGSDCYMAITGGTVIAVYAGGWSENFSSSYSTQGAIGGYFSSSTVSSGTEFSVADEEGNVLASFAPGKSYRYIVVSVDGMDEGDTYVLTAGSVTQTVTLSSLITTISASGSSGGSTTPGGGSTTPGGPTTPGR